MRERALGGCQDYLLLIGGRAVAISGQNPVSGVMGQRVHSHDVCRDVLQRGIISSSRHYQVEVVYRIFWSSLLPCCESLVNELLYPGHEQQVVTVAPAMSTASAPAAMQVFPGRGLGILSECCSE